MTTNGLKTKYELYLKSLDTMQEPVVPKAKLDMRGAIEYAKKKGVRVEDLSREEKDMFIEYISA